MRRGSSLLSDERASMVTPLVDLLFNMMIAMFVFLMIYMAVVIPNDPNPLRFPDFELPPAAPYVPFLSNIKVTQGSGRYLFLFGPEEGVRELRRDPGSGALEAPGGSERSRERIAELRIDESQGVLNGRFFPAAAGPFEFPVVVVDREIRRKCRAETSEQWGEVRLSFHEEQTEAMPQEGQEGEDAGELECFEAIRSNFTVQVQPRSIPHALPPLELAVPGGICIVTGGQPAAAAAAVGGLEPYEFRKAAGPAWLTIDPRTGRLGGTAPAAGEYEVQVEIKDAQTAAGDWAAAQRQQQVPSRPYAAATLRLSVEPRLGTPSIVLPPYGRVGEPVDGVVISRGGCGATTFSVEAPAGMSVNESTGRISGAPAREGDFVIRARVADRESEAATEHRWRVIPGRPAKQVVGGPLAP